MRTLKCIKLDFMKSGSVFKMFILFAAVFILASSVMGDLPPGWGMLYLVFCGIIGTSTPFNVSLNASSVFTDILPASVENRVYGRFLFGAIVIFLAVALGIVCDILRMLLEGNVTWGSAVLPGIYAGIGLFMVALQYLVQYLFCIKNAQVLSLVRMVPGFIMFFGGNALMGEIMKEDPARLPGMIKWLASNLNIFAAAVLAAGVIITVICAVVCCAHEKKKY